MSSSSNPSGAGAGAVSGQTYGAINASTTDHWMIRLPNRLASAWEDAPEGTVLGTLTFTKGGTTNGNSAGQPTAKRQKTNAPSSAPSSSKISITLDPALAESQLDLPVNYSLEAMSKKTNGTLHPFTRNANGGVSIHGLVSRTASVQVTNGSGSNNANASSDARYRNLLKNRLLDTSVNSKRFVQPHADAAPQASKAATFAASLGTGFGGSVAQFGKKVLDAKERQKGFGVEEVSGPPITGADNVRSKLFELFSKRVFWSVKDLIMASGGRLPEKETREILRDIADYHRQGEHRNMWELKGEFKSSISADSNS
mmetsp:Transcript_26464/g.45029  ORF Transcript_26464/g.45029 Transcript_26464/m.45029 type:complete len:313 (-) Transcript_26464:83-1021(-)